MSDRTRYPDGLLLQAKLDHNIAGRPGENISWTGFRGSYHGFIQEILSTLWRKAGLVIKVL